ncbi:MAG: thioredoxin [Bacteroidetes bacterium]|nr:thioredoxin [Bacteroidota bacterium]MDA1121243.1 thioredoxin [Bacteroidota bacterium]
MGKGNFKQLINSDKPVLVDFWAEWCGPCHTLSPIIKEVAAEMADHIKVIKINVDKNQAVANKYQIRSIPTMILFKKGKPVWRQSGVIGKQQIVSGVRGNM